MSNCLIASFVLSTEPSIRRLRLLWWIQIHIARFIDLIHWRIWICATIIVWHCWRLKFMLCFFIFLNHNLVACIYTILIIVVRETIQFTTIAMQHLCWLRLIIYWQSWRLQSILSLAILKQQLLFRDQELICWRIFFNLYIILWKL